MEPAVGKKVAIEMKKRGTGPTQWARVHGFHWRSMNEVLHKGMGSKRGGPVTERIFAKLIEEGYIDENHQFIEKAS